MKEKIKLQVYEQDKTQKAVILNERRIAGVKTQVYSKLLLDIDIEKDEILTALNCPVEPEVMPKIADLRNKLTPFMNLAQMTPLVLGEASNKDYMKAYTAIRSESENIQQNDLIETVRKLLVEIESNFSA